MDLIKSIFLLGLVAVVSNCGIRGAPTPPADPELYNQSYEEYVNEKEKENERKNKFRRGYSPSNPNEKQSN